MESKIPTRFVPEESPHQDRVSSQFHVQHDEFFEIIKAKDNTLAQWKKVTGFTKINRTYKDLDLRLILSSQNIHLC